MSCNQVETNCTHTTGSGFVFILVLYILLAIILGTCIGY